MGKGKRNREYRAALATATYAYFVVLYADSFTCDRLPAQAPVTVTVSADHTTGTVSISGFVEICPPGQQAALTQASTAVKALTAAAGGCWYREKSVEVLRIA